jgi:hypothetical protein
MSRARQDVERAAVPDQEPWYAEQVRRSGDLSQLYVDRGMHCSFSAAEEIVALRILFERIDSGRWPDTSPRRLSEAARDLGPGYQLVLDFGTFQDATMPPAFTNFHATPVPPSVALGVRAARRSRAGRDPVLDRHGATRLARCHRLRAERPRRRRRIRTSSR